MDVGLDSNAVAAQSSFFSEPCAASSGVDGKMHEAKICECNISRVEARRGLRGLLSVDSDAVRVGATFVFLLGNLTR